MNATMETEEQLNARIMELIHEIHENYPELVPFLDELPLTIPNEPNPEISKKILEDYIESLQNLVRDKR